MYVQRMPHGPRVAPYSRCSALDDLTQSTTNAYTASLGMSPDVTIDGLKLAIRGALCDTVSEFLAHDSLGGGEYLLQYKEVSSPCCSRHNFWEHARVGMYVNGETFTAALNRTLAADAKMK